MITNGATGVSLIFRLRDSSTLLAKNGVVVTTLSLQFAQFGAAPSTATALTLLGATGAAYTASGAIEVDAVRSKGCYRVDCPDAAWAGTARGVALTVTGAGIEPETVVVPLTSVDLGIAGGVLPVNVTQVNNASAATSSGGVDLSPGEHTSIVGDVASALINQGYSASLAAGLAASNLTMAAIAQSLIVGVVTAPVVDAGHFSITVANRSTVRLNAYANRFVVFTTSANDQDATSTVASNTSSSTNVTAITLKPTYPLSALPQVGDTCVLLGGGAP